MSAGSNISTHRVLANTSLAPGIHRFHLVAPRNAEVRQPGQFAIVRTGPGRERIPLRIADADPVRGSIILIIQALRKTTEELNRLAPGELMQGIVGRCR